MNVSTVTRDLLFFGEISGSGSSPPGVESDGRPCLPDDTSVDAAAAMLMEEDMEASCSWGWPEVDGGSFASGEASDGADGE